MDFFPERFGKEAGASAALPPAGALIMAIWRDYLARFGAYAPISACLLLTLPFSLPGFLLTVVGVDTTGAILTARPDSSPLMILMTIFGSIGIAIINIGVRAGLNVSVAAGIEHRNLSWREAIRTGSRMFWPFVGTMILLAIVLALGFSLLFFPAIIAGTYLLVAEQAAVLEGLRPVAALKRSIQLVRGHFWAVLWRAAAGYAVIALGSLALSFPLVQIPTAALGHAFADNLTGLRLGLIPVMAAGVIISALAQPLFVSLQVHLFEGLKRLERP